MVHAVFDLYTLSCVGAGVQREGLAPSLGPNWQVLTEDRQNPVSETLYFKQKQDSVLNKNRMLDNV
jgi:hypothetical protein